jgi:hypothetical protein
MTETATVDVAGLVVVVLVSLSVRLSLIWRSRKRGCDAYYFLLCASEFREKRKLPIVLPDYYLLDIQEQWYPPGFSIFLSWFPEKWLKRNYWLITPLTDTLIAAVLYVFVLAQTGIWTAAMFGGLACALSWPAITDCQNLNSRPLGNLLLAVLLLSLHACIGGEGGLWFTVAVLACSLTFLTHKLTTQLAVVLLPLLALLSRDLTPALVLFLGVALAFAVPGNTAIKILKGQADILKFWHHNWSNLGAHQVLSSPVYGDAGRQDPGRVFQPGIRGLIRNTIHLAANPFAVVLPLAVLLLAVIATAIGDGSWLNKTGWMMLWWSIITYGLAASTLFIPRLRFYGEGYKYLRLSVLPVGYLVGHLTAIFLPAGSGNALNAILGGFRPWYIVVIGLAATASLLVIVRGLARVSGKELNPAVDHDLEKVLEYLQRPEVKVVLTIPTHLMDTIVYHCRKPVVWGTHSAGFADVEPLFPVFRKQLEWFVEKYGVSHVVIDKRYVDPGAVGVSGDALLAGPFAVFATGYVSR